ncbi:TRAP-type C4-dicarboxylate transport system substrate-binding protein [Rhodoligotrophos appendicifer]|uniref:TRAP transporter substrate-binding protein n=1 Tax=Rhodoligotrophos appendicifer TaxID=987056 RepID=UPI0014787FB0|nr:TRAP transporter substrate-binding protein [Rhodoligotrophos appendicifer]
MGPSWRQSILAGLALAAATAFAALPAQAETVLKFSAWLPVQHWLNAGVMKPWADAVDEATQGRVRIEFLPKVVGSAQAQFDVVRDGLADVSIIVNGYTPGRFTLLEMGELPFLGTEAVVMSPAFYRIYEEYLSKFDEFDGVHVLSTFTTASGHIYTTKVEIDDLADLKGLKLRSPLGSTAPIMTALGAVPVQKPSTEAYELLSTGVIDGTFLSREGAKGNKILELVPFLTVVPGGLYNAILSVIVNQAKWDAITPEDQAAIMKVSGEALALKIGQAYQKADEDGLEAIKAAGHTVTVANPKLLGEMKEALKPIESAWIEKAKAKGLDNPEEVLAQFRAELQAGAKAN